ncbi:unnamed protein product [Toxocara canis]|uniref:M20_dimer domain-containing protein n=1 Tax=Toxocara canis TaxID=6265 RepID=A0A183VBJ4_TOXCA|nr:unnamed protein product [Toxocara canis]
MEPRIQTFGDCSIAKGYKSLGFSPINKTPRLAHDHNEYLEERTFLRGIEIYEKVILKLGDLPEDKSN